MEARRLRAAGDIDTTFGIDGTVEVPDLIRSFDSVSIAPAGGDKYFLLRDSRIQRVDSSGNPDAAFGGADGASLLAVQPDDAIVVAGGKVLVRGVSQLSDIQNGPPGLGVLQRLKSDGSLDPTFGQQGAVTSTSIEYDLFGVQSNGKIIVVEAELDPTTDVLLPRATLRRLNDDGSIDNTFTPFSFVREGNASLVVLPGSDKILLGGAIGDDNTDVYDSRDSTLMRFNADGTVDTSFGTNGRVAREVDTAGFHFDANALALVSGGNGSFIAADSNRGEEMKFNADGTHDAIFQTPGGNGRADTSSIASVPTHLLAQPDGKTIVYGESGMTRLNADGTIDASFGRVLTSEHDSLKIRGAALTASGDLLTAVNREDFAGDDFAGLTRLQGSGSTPGPVTLAGSTLIVTGTEEADQITVQTVFHFPDPVHDIQVHFPGRMDRLIDLASVTKLVVNALGGDDTVRAYLDLPQSISGGDGNDGLIGGPGDDSISGNAGADGIDGNGGNDRLAGNGGHDKLSGGEGNDILYGGAGPDGLAGEGGNDILKGGAGIDDLYGGDGTDTLAGGDGNDSFSSADGNAESIFGDAGSDSVLSKDDSDILTSIENDLT